MALNPLGLRKNIYDVWVVRTRVVKTHWASINKKLILTSSYVGLNTRRYRVKSYKAPSSATRSTAVQIAHANTHPPCALCRKHTTKGTKPTNAMIPPQLARPMNSKPPFLRATTQESSGSGTIQGGRACTRDMTGVERSHKGRWSPAYGLSRWIVHKWTVFRVYGSNSDAWGCRQLPKHCPLRTGEWHEYWRQHVDRPLKNLWRRAMIVYLSKDWTTGCFGRRWRRLPQEILQCLESVRGV
jgi:hypothetical protein